MYPIHSDLLKKQPSVTDDKICLGTYCTRVRTLRGPPFSTLVSISSMYRIGLVSSDSAMPFVAAEYYVLCGTCKNRTISEADNVLICDSRPVQHSCITSCSYVSIVNLFDDSCSHRRTYWHNRTAVVFSPRQTNGSLKLNKSQPLLSVTLPLRPRFLLFTSCLRYFQTLTTRSVYKSPAHVTTVPVRV